MLASKTSLVFAIADGVGGYRGGKEASEIAIDIIKNESSNLENEQALSSCLLRIDQEIKQKAHELNYVDMGTTVALAKILPTESKVITANVGDSPIFLISGNTVDPIYKDDSMRFEDPSNMWSIIQYLGYDGPLEIHYKSANYTKGDYLLLCSDGVSDNILGTNNNLSKIGDIVREARGDAKVIVKRAVEIGIKHDDISAVLVCL